MRITHKYYKDSDFEARSDMAYDLRITDMKKVNTWTPSQKENAIKFLEQCKLDTERALARMRQSAL